MTANTEVKQATAAISNVATGPTIAITSEINIPNPDAVKTAKVTAPTITLQSTQEPTFKYDEPKFMTEAYEHIKKTYGAHYSGAIQTTEYIMSNATSLDFLSGNVQAYIARFGKKNGYNVEDLWKAVHFISMMAYYAERKFKS